MLLINPFDKRRSPSCSPYKIWQPAGSSVALNAEMSKSIPFLTAPKNTKGYVGDAGFDPFALSGYFDIKWMRESELKHCRAAMLATVGFVAQQFITLPGMTHVDDANLAPAAAGVSPMFQIFLGLGVIEWWSYSGNVTMETMFKDTNRVPGNFGFDPLGFTKNKSAEEVADLELKEIKNGRLAMLAIGGMIHHNFATGDPLF